MDAPPRKLVIATGSREGAYYKFAQLYAKQQATLLSSTGKQAAEELKQGKVDVVFLVASSPDRPPA